MKPTERKRVLIVGLDGATWDLAGPWAEQGHLPTIRRLRLEGAWGTLQSTVPALSPPAWTSIITGQNPGKHGVYDFVRREPGSYRLQTMRRDFRRFRTIFRHLSDEGRRVAAVNIPMTYPPEEINGLFVAGLGAPTNGPFAKPDGLRTDLLRRGYRIEPRISFAPGNERAYVTELRDTTKLRANIALDLYRQEPWDLFMVVFRAPDEAVSFLWHLMDNSHPWHDPELAAEFGDAIQRVYQDADQALADFLDVMPDDTNLLAVSDHGGGPLLREVYLNNWLAQQGWLSFRDDEAARSNRTAWLRRLGLTRESLSRRLKGTPLHRLQDWVPLSWQHRLFPAATPTLADAVDWSRTRAYSFGYIGQIYVNLRGREPQGIVEPGAEYETLLSEISSALSELRDDQDGQPVVDRVYRRDKLYAGPYAGEGPDLNLIMRDMSYITHPRRELAHRDVFGPVTTNESGTHRVDGLFLAYGPAVAAGQEISGARVVDIAPTVYHLLGLPVPAGMDGQVLVTALDGHFMDGHPVTRDERAGELPDTTQGEATWSAEEEAEILERLRHLGYVD